MTDVTQSARPRSESSRHRCTAAAPGSSWSHASQANASRQNLSFCLTPVFLEMLLQGSRSFGGSAERAPSCPMRWWARVLDGRQDQALARLTDLQADSRGQPVLFAQVAWNHDLTL